MTDQNKEVIKNNKKLALADIILTVLGIFMLTFGTWAMSYAIYHQHPAWSLWLCYIALIAMGYGAIIRAPFIIAAQLNILTIPILFWLADFFFHLFGYGNLLGLTNYYFNDLLWGARIIGLEHFFLLPLGYICLYLLKLPSRQAWKLSMVQAGLVALAFYFFTDKTENVNCLLHSCFSIATPSAWYPLQWSLSIAMIIMITNSIITRLAIFRQNLS